MDLRSGKYLNHEICAFSGNDKNMWLIVYDGRYNYMLFKAEGRVLSRYKADRMPYNDFVNRTKMVEYFSAFDNAIKNLVKVVANNGFLNRIRFID